MASELGRRARELVQELKSYDKHSLPPFNEELVRLVFSEIDEHHAQTEAIISGLRKRQEESGEEVPVDELTATTMCLHYECIKRNKRLLLVYMNERMNRLKQMRWALRQLPEAQRAKCCQSELQFYSDYSRALDAYTGGKDGVGVDLTLEMKPPKDGSVLVRCIKDAGETITSYGRATLKLGATISLPPEEADPLIRQGVVETVAWEEIVGQQASAW